MRCIYSMLNFPVVRFSAFIGWCIHRGGGCYLGWLFLVYVVCYSLSSTCRRRFVDSDFVSIFNDVSTHPSVQRYKIRGGFLFQQRRAISSFSRFIFGPLAVISEITVTSRNVFAPRVIPNVVLCARCCRCIVYRGVCDICLSFGFRFWDFRVFVVRGSFRRPNSASYCNVVVLL